MQARPSGEIVLSVLFERATSPARSGASRSASHAVRRWKGLLVVTIRLL